MERKARASGCRSCESMQGLPGGSSEGYQHRKRRQRWLLLLLAVLMVLAALLLGRGILPLLSVGAKALVSTPGGMISPTATPALSLPRQRQLFRQLQG